MNFVPRLCNHHLLTDDGSQKSRSKAVPGRNGSNHVCFFSAGTTPRKNRSNNSKAKVVRCQKANNGIVVESCKVRVSLETKVALHQLRNPAVLVKSMPRGVMIIWYATTRVGMKLVPLPSSP